MIIDDDLISKLENLSKIKLETDEKENLKIELEGMIHMFDKIGTLDTDNEEPLLHLTNAKNIFRNDEVKQIISREEALKNAPNRQKNFFTIPKIID